jgi:hypothetical protein
MASLIDDWPRKIRVAINDEIKYKADLKTNKSARRSLTYNFRIVEESLEELAERIRNRENLTNECRELNGKFHRAKEYFKYSELFGVDVDNDKEVTTGGKKLKVKLEGEEYLSFEGALEHPFVKQYCSISYTTASHTDEHHKLRLLFATQEPITNRERYERILRALKIGRAHV